MWISNLEALCQDVTAQDLCSEAGELAEGVKLQTVSLRKVQLKALRQPWAVPITSGLRFGV